MKIVKSKNESTYTLNIVKPGQEPGFCRVDTIGKIVKVDGRACVMTTHPNKPTKCPYIKIDGVWYYFVDPNTAISLRMDIGVPLEWTTVRGRTPGATAKPRKPRAKKAAKPKAKAPRLAKDKRQGFSAHLHDSPLARSEKNDCIVRAVMECMGVHYDEAHEMVMRTGFRQPKRGTYTSSMMSRDTFFRSRFDPVPAHGMTVAQFLAANPKGNYIVTVKWHGFAVKDGVVVDYLIKPRQKVQLAWEWNGVR